MILQLSIIMMLLSQCIWYFISSVTSSTMWIQGYSHFVILSAMINLPYAHDIATTWVQFWWWWWSQNAIDRFLNQLFKCCIERNLYLQYKWSTFNLMILMSHQTDKLKSLPHTPCMYSVYQVQVTRIKF